MERAKDRFYYLDYLRGFMVLLVVLDHSMHAYSQHYADFWFMSDVDRSVFIDVLHLHNDAIMMPFLLSLAGLFTFVSLERRGLLSFFKERLTRLGIPFFFGVSVIASFLSYNKSVIREGYLGGFFDFYFHHYLHWENAPFENFVMGSFWFIYYLAVLTAIALVLYYALPWVIRFLGTFVTFLLSCPLQGFIIVGLISALILGVSDILWGAHWWFGFKPVFYVRRARFLIEGFCYFLGVGAYFAGFLKDPELLKKLTDTWKLWVGLSLVIGGLYTWYSIAYFYEGAYNRDIAVYFMQGGTFKEALGMVFSSGTWPLIRTTLLGFYIAALIPLYVALFGKFLNTPKPFWMSLAACSFGIYIFHEPISLWVHVKLYGFDIPAVVKFIISGTSALALSWGITKVLLKVPGVKRVL